MTIPGTRVEVEKGPVAERLKTKLAELLETIPPSVKDRIKLVKSQQVDAVREDTTDTTHELLGIEGEADPKTSTDELAKYEVLKAIMGGDVTGEVKPEVTAKFKEMALLAASALASWEGFIGVENGEVKYPDITTILRSRFAPGTEELCKELAPTLAPYAAIAIATDKETYKEGTTMGLEGAFMYRNANVSWLTGRLDRLIGDYFLRCLDGTTEPLILRSCLKNAETNQADRNIVVRMNWSYYIGDYLWRELVDYLSVMLAAKINPKKDKPSTIKLKDARADLTQTFSGKTFLRR